MPRAFSSGAASIWSYGLYSPKNFVIAAVSDVLPWSTCPIVPTFTCGLLRSNLPLAMGLSVYLTHSGICCSPAARLAAPPRQRSLCVLLLDFLGDRGRHRLVVVELHRVLGAALRHRPEIVDVLEHVGERHHGVDNDRDAARLLPLDLAAPRVQVADDVADIVLRRHHLDLHDRLEQLHAELGRGFPEA